MSSSKPRLVVLRAAGPGLTLCFLGLCFARVWHPLPLSQVRFSENIDFQYPMKQACAKEMERFCDVVPHGGGRVIRCLQVRAGQQTDTVLVLVLTCSQLSCDVASN